MKESEQSGFLFCFSLIVNRAGIVLELGKLLVDMGGLKNCVCICVVICTDVLAWE